MLLSRICRGRWSPIFDLVKQISMSIRRSWSFWLAFGQLSIFRIWRPGRRCCAREAPSSVWCALMLPNWRSIALQVYSCWCPLWAVSGGSVIWKRSLKGLNVSFTPLFNDLMNPMTVTWPEHDYQFEELLQMGVKLEDTRAYIFVDSQGNLEYKNIVSSLKLLGSKFFMNCSPVASTPAESRHMMSMLFSMMKPGSHRQKKTKLLLGRPGKNGIFSMTTMIPMQSFACNSKRACVKPGSVTLNLQHVTIRILMLGVESPTRTRAVDFGVPPRVSTIPRARVRADSGSRLPSASWNLNAGAAVPKGTGKLSVL